MSCKINIKGKMYDFNKTTDCEGCAFELKYVIIFDLNGKICQFC